MNLTYDQKRIDKWRRCGYAIRIDGERPGVDHTGRWALEAIDFSNPDGNYANSHSGICYNVNPPEGRVVESFNSKDIDYGLNKMAAILDNLANTRIINRNLDLRMGGTGRRVLLAVESGSRAWGFASADSDYDVRFVYAGDLADYLSMYPGRDTMEWAADGSSEWHGMDLDFHGWDAKKALRLFREGNPQFMEWLESPIIYADHEDVLRRLRDLKKEYWSPAAAIHHYFGMAMNNWSKYLLNRDVVTSKKYLYVLRPVLACLHLLDGGESVPMAFDDLLQHTGHLLFERAQEELDELLAEKRAGAELGSGPQRVALHAWLGGKMQELSEADFPKKDGRDPGPVDALLFEILTG